MKRLSWIVALGMTAALGAEPESGAATAEAIEKEKVALREEIARLQQKLAELDSKVRVPTPEPARKGHERELLVHLEPGGAVMVEGKKTSHEDLLKKLRALVEVNGAQPVRIGADRQTTYVDLMGVVELCQKAGVWDISFTKRPTTPNGEAGPASK